MRIAVVGGGILGLATARQLAGSGHRVTVLEKEPALGRHQTGRNSGVVHAGLYYPAGSLKARLCTRGVGLLRAYCADRDLPYEECGKVVVAVEAREEAGLRTLEERGHANGVAGLRMLDAAQLRRIEPHADGRLALHSPRTAICDFTAVAAAYADDVRAADGEVRTGVTVSGVDASNGEALVRHGGGADAFDRVVVCAGLYSDRLAHASGGPRYPTIVPFRGDYLALRPQARDLVKGLIYPVPDPRYPFLGVHLTRTVHGGVLVGPNAVLAFAREGYRLRDVRPSELAATLTDPGFLRLARRHWRTGADEIWRAMSRRRFVAAARRYVPELRPGDVVRAPAGVRAQAVDRDGSMVEDFRIERNGRVVQVRNAPSPAATSSLAIAEVIVERVLADG